MSILYNHRFHTRRNDILDGLMRLAGIILFAASIMIMTISIHCWGM